MHPILARALAAGSALVALAVAVALGAGVAEAAARPAARAAVPRSAASGPVRHVVLIGVPGLRWAQVSAAATPALWRLARRGSVGSLSVTGVSPVSCPADGWLTLNAGARAAAPRTATGSCARLPPVTEVRSAEMPTIISFNQPYNENPAWGLLRSAAGPSRCTTAVGRGAALALASRTGQVGTFLPQPAELTRAEMARCPLTVVDAGALAGPISGPTMRRSAGSARRSRPAPSWWWPGSPTPPRRTCGCWSSAGLASGPG